MSPRLRFGHDQTKVNAGRIMVGAGVLVATAVGIPIKLGHVRSVPCSLMRLRTTFLSCDLPAWLPLDVSCLLGGQLVLSGQLAAVQLS